MRYRLPPLKTKNRWRNALLLYHHVSRSGTDAKSMKTRRWKVFYDAPPLFASVSLGLCVWLQQWKGGCAALAANNTMILRPKGQGDNHTSCFFCIHDTCRRTKAKNRETNLVQRFPFMVNVSYGSTNTARVTAANCPVCGHPCFCLFPPRVDRCLARAVERRTQRRWCDNKGQGEKRRRNRSSVLVA